MNRLHALSLLLLIFCAPILANSQSTDATISGVVVDPSGKVITDADIEILNEDKGVHYSGKTNGTGIYNVSILPPGQYRVQVSKEGFKTIIKPDVILNVQSAVALNFTLPVGATSESITVDAGASLINMTDASVSTVIDQKFVENIPLNGRSFQDLISMTPGVVTQSPQAQSSVGLNGDFSVNGQRDESNYYTVDGVAANVSGGTGGGTPEPGNTGSLPSSTALGTTQSLLSVDALQEFRVESSTYSAEYGHTPGAQFSLVTRSGTNIFKGTLFDYLRNNYFDANDWFNDHYGQPISALRQNDFGGTLGGPIWLPRLYDGRDKSFFFASYEGLRLTQPEPASIQYVPDVYLRQQAPLALQPILNAYPIPNGIDYGNSQTPSLAQLTKSFSLPSQIDAVSLRLDHTLTPKLMGFARYGFTPSSTNSRNLSEVQKVRSSSESITLGVTSQMSRNASGDFRLSYLSAKASQTGALDDFGGATPLNLPASMGVPPQGTAAPTFFLYFPTIGESILQTSNGSSESRQWNTVDTATVLLGHHHLRFGIDYRWLHSILTPPHHDAEAVFESPESVLTNSTDLLYIVKRNNATPSFNETSAFIQDEWKATANLTLSLGLRWEIDPSPSSPPYTLLGNLNAPSSLTLAPRGTPLWKTTWYNFAPRLGASWLVHDAAQWETVVRAGGGVFFDTDNELATQGYGGVGFTAMNYLFGVALPAVSSDFNFAPSLDPPYTSSSIYAFPAHLQLPYALEWNVALQQALGAKQALTISYVASNGRRLLQQQELNLSDLTANFGTAYYLKNGVTSNYQALQASFQRTLRDGIQVLAAYTWGHSLDFGSNSYAVPLTRGNSDFDVRNTASAGLTWDLPFIHDHTPVQALISHWSLDGRLMARTAFPVTLQGNLLTDPGSGSTYFGNVNYDPSRPLYLYGSQFPGGRAINGGPLSENPAITTAGGSSAGNAPRNFVRGFNATQVNLALHREIPLYEAFRLQLRAEAFNMLNHPNFGYVDPNLNDQTFGQTTQSLSQSLGTVSALYQQGGARSLQIALKILF